MHIDNYWLSDTELSQLSRQIPSTEFGNELMSKWPARYPGLLSSDTYRGCAIALFALSTSLNGGMVTIAAIEQAIETLHDSLVKSNTFAVGMDRQGGATVTLSNAWEGADSGVSARQAVEAYESEAIFAARMFVRAREQELAGIRLP
jgi:hypothetical protein